ncbi:hypothetical protein C8Q76DRAFT_802836 [Earliella scabrosa]|nr:hypothetical protein C8Q76DRAFT_802836 [Earliella scabrosa]
MPHVQLDLKSILAWQRTARAGCATGARALRSSLLRLLTPFVGNSDNFLHTLYNTRAVIAGELALAFMLRDPHFHFHFLQIYVPFLWYDKLITSLEAILHPSLERFSSFARLPKLLRHASSCAHFRLRSGLSVLVYQSSTSSALSPITSATCSALVNFVTPYSFGCGYPDLTLSRRAILADDSLLIGLPFDYEILHSLDQQGFDIAWSPARFVAPPSTTPAPRTRSPSPLSDPGSLIAMSSSSDEEDDAVAPPPTAVHNTLHYLPRWGVPAPRLDLLFSRRRQPAPCYADVHCCPNQLRFFGDRTSLLDFIDPAGTDRHLLEDRNLPPFGSIVIWQLSSSYECARGLACSSNPRNTPHPGVVYLPAMPGKNYFGGKYRPQWMTWLSGHYIR